MSQMIINRVAPVIFRLDNKEVLIKGYGEITEVDSTDFKELKEKHHDFKYFLDTEAFVTKGSQDNAKQDDYTKRVSAQQEKTKTEPSK